MKVKLFEEYVNDYRVPLKVLISYKDGHYATRNLEEGDVVYFQTSRYRGTVIIKAYKSVRDRLPGKIDIPEFPYTIHVTKPDGGGVHVNGDILLPGELLEKTLEIVEKYSSPENDSAATKEIIEIIEKYSAANARKWETEVTRKKFGF